MRQLGDLIDLFDYKRVPVNSRDRATRKGPYPYYGASGIVDYVDSYIFEGRHILIAEDGENLRSRKTPISFFADGKFWVNNHAHIAKAKPGIADDYYIMIVLEHADISGFITGAAQPKLNQQNLNLIEIPCPPLMNQRRIADVLSAYDDLIENNTRRIKILEEMARRAFELSEAQATDAPKRPLGDIADAGGGTVRTGPFGSQLHESDYTAEGTPVVMPKNLLLGRIDTSDIARVPDDIAQKVEQHRLSKGDIVYGRRGDIGRRAYVGRHQDGWICGTGCLRISLGSGPLHSRYLHEFLGKPEIVSSIAGKAIGATMPNLNTSILRGVEVPIPDAHVQHQFVNLALANDDLVENLRARSAILTAQRDFLLPRLISGEIELHP